MKIPAVTFPAERVKSPALIVRPPEAMVGPTFVRNAVGDPEVLRVAPIPIVPLVVTGLEEMVSKEVEEERPTLVTVPLPPPPLTVVQDKLAPEPPDVKTCPEVPRLGGRIKEYADVEEFV